MLLFEKKRDALWADPNLVKIWTWAFGMGREQFTPELDITTRCYY